MLSKKLYFIFGTGAIVVIILVAAVLPWQYQWMSAFVIPFVVLLVLSYVFSPQIDWWWYQKHPPELPGNLGNLLLQHLPFYKNLSVENKKRFRQRTAMYLQARGFYAKQGSENGEVPLDIKTMLAGSVVMMTFGQEKFILDKFERIFIYLQAFPSPDHPYLHSVELNEEDACLLFSGEHVILSFRQAHRFYNVITHGFAKAFQLTFPNYDYPDFDEAAWSVWGKEHILKYLGIPEDKVNLFGVLTNYFFHAPQKMKAENPRVFEKLSSIFNLNPLEVRDPVIDKSVVANVP